MFLPGVPFEKQQTRRRWLKTSGLNLQDFVQRHFTINKRHSKQKIAVL